MKLKPRIMILTAGKSGRDHSAFSGLALYDEYKKRPDLEEPVLLQILCDKQHINEIVRKDKNEYIWIKGRGDIFSLMSHDHITCSAVLGTFIKAEQPDIIHIHQGSGLDWDIIEIIRRVSPKVKIFVTLHDYTHICPGSYLLKADGSICNKSDPQRCADCLSCYSPSSHWRRKRNLLHFLQMADGIFCASCHLQMRSMSWGIAADRIHVIPNCCPVEMVYPDIRRDNAEKPVRYGFFGEFSSTSGLDTIFLALDSLGLKLRKGMGLRIDIHGYGLENGSEDFRKRICQWVQKYGQEGIITWDDKWDAVEKRIPTSSIDWILMPASACTSSPLVMELAQTARIPVLCSDRGGAAEKVMHGINGLLVSALEYASWNDALKRTCGNVELWKLMKEAMQENAGAAIAAELHLKMAGVITSEWDW